MAAFTPKFIQSFHVVSASVSQSVQLYLTDSSGAGYTTPTPNADLRLWAIRRTTTADTQLPVALAAQNSAFQDGGMYSLAQNLTNPTGTWRVDIPDAWIAFAAPQFLLMVTDQTDKTQVYAIAEIRTALYPANVTQIDGQPTNGYNATLNLKALNVQNVDGDAMTLTSTGNNGRALALQSNGSGHALNILAGTSGRGINISGGATGGNGVLIASNGTSSGLKITPSGTGHGLEIVGGATTGDAIRLTVTNGSDAGIRGSLVGNITGNLSGSVGSVTAAVTAGTVNDKAGYSLSSSGLNLVLVAGVAIPEAVRRIAATTVGEASGAGSGTEVFKDFAGATCATIIVDTAGNRSSITFS